MTPAGMDRAYSAHSSLTSVHPYAAFDLSEDLTLWGQAGYGRGEMNLVQSHVRGAELERAGVYRTGNGLAMAALGARGALPGVGGFSLAVKSDVFRTRRVQAGSRRRHVLMIMAMSTTRPPSSSTPDAAAHWSARCPALASVTICA